MHAVCDLGDAVGKLQVGGGRVNRIAAQYQQRANLICVDVAEQGAQRLHLVAGVRQSRFEVLDGAANVAQRIVQRVRQGVHDRWLILAGDDERRTVMRLQIGDQRGNRFRQRKVV